MLEHEVLDYILVVYLLRVHFASTSKKRTPEYVCIEFDVCCMFIATRCYMHGSLFGTFSRSCLFFYISNVSFMCRTVHAGSGISNTLATVFCARLLAYYVFFGRCVWFASSVPGGWAFVSKFKSEPVVLHSTDSSFPCVCATQWPLNIPKGKHWKGRGFDLRGEVFCHGQLYVALSRSTCRDNFLCLVKPEHLVDGVPYVHNVVFWVDRRCDRTCSSRFDHHPQPLRLYSGQSPAQWWRFGSGKSRKPPLQLRPI